MALNVTVLGVGLVGKELVRQLGSASLAPRFRIVTLANSKRQIRVGGSSPAAASGAELLAALQSGSDPRIESKSLAEVVADTIDAARDAPQLLIDCTSDDGVAQQYPALLRAGVNICTPNKKAFSGPRELYDDLTAASDAPTGGLCYRESTVGAGLPIIGTLADLLATGDEIVRIEGVFSGTLSYLFNSFSKPDAAFQAPPFSSVVKQAKDQGYTEPHPGDDLNGSDVARKLCILARMVASPELPDLPQGYASVPTQSLVPSALEGIKSGDDFVAQLPAHDAEFEQQRAEAAREGKVLRFVGVVDVQNRKLSCGLNNYPFSHPFAASLGGSDNIISFTTKRYTRPLIIQGAGAGAALTAHGVVGDALRIHERVIRRGA